MDVRETIESFNKLGSFLLQFTGGQIDNKLSILNKNHFNIFKQLIETDYIYNTWFTPENIIASFNGISKMIVKEDLEKWVNTYNIGKYTKSRVIGVVMAGNIPLVGFHDLLCVIMSGHNCICKMSSKDNRIIKALINVLVAINPSLKDRIQLVEEKLTGFDAIIATGSNNTSRYFEYYFGKYPHIIRKNRNSIAVLSGNEKKKELKKLADDIFLYFGLGCRNVSKLFVPEKYKFDLLFECFEHYNLVLNHNKYMNNHDYYRSIYLVNKQPHLDNGFLIIKEDTGLASPIAVTYYQTYRNFDEIISYTEKNNNNIQCIVAGNKEYLFKTIPFGKTQYPGLTDYADNVDIMKFLTTL